MALMRCPECKKKVSESAEYCPNCGFSINKPCIITKEKILLKIGCNMRRLKIDALILIMLWIGVFLFWGIVTSNIYDGKYDRYYILISVLLIFIIIFKLSYQLYSASKKKLILTNKRITGKYNSGIFKLSDFDYPLSTVKNISTSNFFGIETIMIKFYEGFLTTSWIKFTGMENTKEFKDKFFEIGK